MPKLICYILIKGNIKKTVTVYNNRALVKQETIHRPSRIGGDTPCKNGC